jgi:hypothetical protein
MIIGYRLQPVVSFTEPDVRATLAQLEERGDVGNNAVLQVTSAFWLSEVLPDEALFTPDGWEVLRGHLLGRRLIESDTAAQRLDRLLGTPDLLRAVVNGWFNPEEFGLASATIRRVILDATDASRNRWFGPEEIAVANRADGTPAGYTVLNTDDLARRVQCLTLFGTLDVVDGIPVVDTLLRHQVLSEQLPAGRRQLPFPDLLHGTFLFYGEDPVRDTYHALVVLESFGALQRMDREACIRGILRFHHGRGLFGSVQPGDGFVIFGDSRDTFWAFESLRILDALDRVKDLPHWQFRPMFTSQSSNQPREVGPMTWAEIEEWVCRQRFERFLRERDGHAPAPARSLLEP